jgi:non-heme chloroperoxidase
MLFFLGKGFRVIAHDRRGHGRSTQPGDGHAWIITPTTWRH